MTDRLSLHDALYTLRDRAAEEARDGAAGAAVQSRAQSAYDWLGDVDAFVSSLAGRGSDLDDVALPPVEFLPPETAPKDGTLLLLSVRPDFESWTPFEDSRAPYTTIGFNGLEHTGEDRWQFAGWNWSQDCIVEGHGEVVGWAPIASAARVRGDYAVTCRDIEEAQDRVGHLQRQYLARFGWVETCNTPGAYWLWRRNFADVDARLRAWWETTKAKVEAEGRKAPSEPRPFGVVTATRDMAVSMTATVLDDSAPAEGGE